MGLSLFRLGWLTAFGIVAVTTTHGAKMERGDLTAAEPQSQPFGGTQIASLVSPYATATYSGTLVSRVYQGDPTNTQGSLTFTYQLFSNPLTYEVNPSGMWYLSISGFNSYRVDMTYAIGSGDIAPRTFARDLPGGVIRENFRSGPEVEPGLMDGASSTLLIVRTNAVGYIYQIANLSTGAVSPVNALAPAGILAPEPAAALLIPLLIFNRQRSRDTNWWRMKVLIRRRTDLRPLRTARRASRWPADRCSSHPDQ